MVVGGNEQTEKRKQKTLLYRLSIFIIPWFFRLMSLVLFSTCRLQRPGYETYKKLAESGEPLITAFWHYGIIYIVYRATDYPYVAMVSPSEDGEYISKILESKGVLTVRGSRSKGGIGAIKGLIRQVKKGRIGVLVADGSQGPARKAQPGAVLLASRTGAPIIPLSWAASRYMSFRSWDKTALPFPFSKIVMTYGEPMYVPKESDAGQIEKYRIELEKRLNDLYEKGWAEFGKNEH